MKAPLFSGGLCDVVTPQIVPDKVPDVCGGPHIFFLIFPKRTAKPPSGRSLKPGIGLGSGLGVGLGLGLGWVDAPLAIFDRKREKKIITENQGAFAGFDPQIVPNEVNIFHFIEVFQAVFSCFGGFFSNR